MLTKNDLEQIRIVFREEIENEAQSIKDELGADISSSKLRIQEDLDELKDRIKNIEIRMTKMHKELKEELKTVSHVLDKENMRTRKRVEQIEEHIAIDN